MASSFICVHCCYSDDSASWRHATVDEFEPVPRICRTILAAYEPDPRSPEGSHGLNPDWIIKHVTYKQTHGHTPPYLIYTDHLHREIVLAIRGLNIANNADYMILLDNRLGMQMFDGGYVHHGLLRSAIWLLNEEFETLKNLWVDNGRSYTMVFAGHSLGSGVAATSTMVAMNHLDRLGEIPRNLIRCYAVAPARCMSINLAVKYSDAIHSIILQIHTKRRNRLEQKRLNDLVYVRHNQILHHRYQKKDNIDPISLKDIDESNEWLTGMMESHDLDEGGDGTFVPDLVFPGEDLDWAVVFEAMGVDEPRARTRTKGKAPVSTSIGTTTNVYQRRGRARLTQVGEGEEEEDDDDEEEEEFVGDDDDSDSDDYQEEATYDIDSA